MKYLIFLTIFIIYHIQLSFSQEEELAYGVKDERCTSFEPSDENPDLFLSDPSDCSKFYKVFFTIMLSSFKKSLNDF